MIIVDTGFWVALFNVRDQYHQSAQDSLAQYSDEPLITTWCVLTETCHLLLKRSSNPYQGVQNQIKLLKKFLEIRLRPGRPRVIPPKVIRGIEHKFNP
jgi:predicted nucleic acid-binding protein